MKNVVITGATNGIGLSVVRQLINKNFQIYIIGKNKEKGNKIISELNKTNLNYINCDLSELSEVKHLISELKKLKKIDILVNNAGAIFSKRVLNSEKIEKTFALNHLSYFYLTLGLIDNLELSENPMIINVASQAHKRFKLDLSDIENKKFYSGWKSYCRSKLLNILSRCLKVNELRCTHFFVALISSSGCSSSGRSSSGRSSELTNLHFNL